MGILPDNKLRSSIWIIVSLLYFSIVSCSRFGLPDFFSAKLENQTSGEIVLQSAIWKEHFFEFCSKYPQ